jgi:hypothetical protein
MSQSQIDREFRSIFTDDSGGYFKIKKMEEVTLKGDDGPFAEIKGEKGARYIVSLDPSWAENDNSDDFAVSIFKINEEQKVATLVHAYAMPGESPKNHVAYFTYILENFNVVFIIGDYMGSVQFFATFNESDAVKKKGLELKIIEGISFDDSEKYHEELPKLKDLYNLADRRIVYLKYASSGWIRYANELLAANIDHKKIWFANDPRNSEGIYKERLESNVNIENLIFDRKGHIIGEGEKTNAVKIIDLIEISYDNIRATKVQTALVQITTSAQGTQSFDLPVELKKQKGPNRPRKDSYSALVLGNWAFKIFSDMEKYDGVRASNTFVPFMI